MEAMQEDMGGAKLILEDAIISDARLDDKVLRCQLALGAGRYNAVISFTHFMRCDPVTRKHIGMESSPSWQLTGSSAMRMMNPGRIKTRAKP